MDFSGALVVKNLPGGTGSIAGLGRFYLPQGNQAPVAQLLSLGTLEPVFHDKNSPCSQEPVRRN